MGEVIDDVRYFPSRAVFVGSMAQWDALGEAEKEESHDTPPAYDARLGTVDDADVSAGPGALNVPVVLAMASSKAAGAPPPSSDVNEEDVVLAFAAGVIIGAAIGAAAGRWSAS